MDTILSFISENITWVIAIAVILLLALIGYIAEKQGFGKENKNNKKEDSVAINQELMQKQIVNEDINSNFEQPEESDNNSDSIDAYSDHVDNLKEDNTEDEKQEDSTEEAEKKDINDDLYAPFGDKKFKNPDNLNIDKDFNSVLDDVEEATDEVDIELPNIEPTSKEELEEEDIWKF